jgi:RNA polymerase sigma factor (sigma-70 family)
VDGNEKRALVAEMAAQHDVKVRRFLRTRLRHALADVPDLVQEVFLRLLRVSHPEAIRTPEAYLYTVAKAVLHQHRARRNAIPEAVALTDVLAELEDPWEIGPEARLDAEQRLAELHLCLSHLPRKAYATLVLNRIVGMPLEEVGARLGISRAMAKKYLAKALAHCRQRDQEIG